jgi:hypothetical protein
VASGLPKANRRSHTGGMDAGGVGVLLTQTLGNGLKQLPSLDIRTQLRAFPGALQVTTLFLQGVHIA